MEYYKESIKDIYKELKSSKEGLSIEEVNKRLNKYGKNSLTSKKKESNIIKFLKEFKDIMIIILLISAVISFVISFVNNESYTDSIVIVIIVILNAILGFTQELKADKALEELKKMQITEIFVRRNNKVMKINSENLVKGDILLLEAGNTIPADARVIYSSYLKTDESSLTGESLPVLKDNKIINDDKIISLRTNMLYSGTNVVYGKGEAIVVNTGMETEFGKIAKNLENEEKEITPLEIKINSISKVLSLIIIIIVSFMFVLGKVQGMNTLEIFMLSISLAVAAIPEGLPAVITIVLSLGMNSLAKKNAIVRKISSVETLGCTEIICSDKTGTITQNKMKVVEVFYNNKIYKKYDLDKDNILLKIMCLNNDANINDDGFVGDPTETALLEYVNNYFDVNIEKNNKRLFEIPFDSERKLMTTVFNINNKKYVFTKGSFDSLIKKCNYVLEDNKKIKLNKIKRNKLKKIEINENKKAYRTLAYAYKEIKEIDKKNIEDNLIFVGLTSSIDPPRTDVKEAIELCKKSNITPIMITGDSLDTAIAISKEIGIITDESEAILGSDLDNISKEDLKHFVKKYKVYARVSPTNKLDIVNAWKENGKIVAMTGDGVNDAPALKTANIGIGMGITGTDVSKSVSDIILVDDSFSTIVTAVEEGRKIYDNIRKVIMYLLNGNIAEVAIVFIGMVLGVEIFLPIQLLYINLITDSIPAISLAFEKKEKDIMNRKIRKKDESFFTPYFISKMLGSAILETFAILICYIWGRISYNDETAATMAFISLTFMEMISAFSCKDLKNVIIGKRMFDNKYLNIGSLLLLIVQLIIIFTPIKELFGIISLNSIQISYIIAIIILIFTIDEISKTILRKIFKDN